MNEPARPLEILDDPERAGALLHPLRMRLIERLRRPDSAAGVARDLGLPRQKVNYHLRELEKVGLVKLVEERKQGNVIERVLQSVAHSFVIDPGSLGALASDPEVVQDRFSSSYLVSLAARIIRQVAKLRRAADAAGKKLPTLALHGEVQFRSIEDQIAFADELSRAFRDLVAKYHTDDARKGRRFQVFAGGYPSVPDGDSRPKSPGSR